MTNTLHRLGHRHGRFAGGGWPGLLLVRAAFVEIITVMQARVLLLALSLLLAACDRPPAPTPPEHKEVIGRIAGDLCMAAAVSCELSWKGPRRQQREGTIANTGADGPKIKIEHVRTVLLADGWEEKPEDVDGDRVFVKPAYELRYSPARVHIRWLGAPQPQP